MTQQNNPTHAKPDDGLDIILYKLRPRMLRQTESPTERVEAVREAKAKLLAYFTARERRITEDQLIFVSKMLGLGSTTKESVKQMVDNRLAALQVKKGKQDV